MLYGSEERQALVLREAYQYAETIGATLIFGAMVGSVSKNIQYADSDYDTRFLYLRNDFPNKICIPSEMTEDELVKRYYPEDEVFEWIPFWEATSFLQFLVNPSFKDDFSVGLYNIVGWTFQSPYVWDPYGLQNRLMPLINNIFRSDYEIAYHKKEIGLYWENIQCERVVAKDYLYAVHAAATIEWSIKYREQPPINLETLLRGLGRREIWAESQKILNQARLDARTRWNGESNKLQSLHFEIFTPHNPLLLEYVSQYYHIDDSQETGGQAKAPVGTPEEIVSDMYEIIYRSVFENEPLQYIGKSEKGK